MSTKTMRVEYEKGRLIESEAPADPIEGFRVWFEAAVSEGVPEPNAMTLATAGADGRPDARIVLLKGFDACGFSFFTNRESRKAREIAENPFASLVFFWPAMERQVRVEGRVDEVSDAEADAYFLLRPPSARLGAWASRQSQVVPNREALEMAFAEMERKYADGNIPRPPHWGGYRVVPDVIEFWQGRVGRLHDRLRYRKADAGWIIERLSP